MYAHVCNELLTTVLASFSTDYIILIMTMLSDNLPATIFNNISTILMRVKSLILLQTHVHLELSSRDTQKLHIIWSIELHT